MSDNFMVTLISNGSMNFYPQNVGNNFTNRPGEPIDLRGAVMNEDMSWEVGMADFQYTNVFDQVNKAIDCRIVLVYPSTKGKAVITRDTAAEEPAVEQAAGRRTVCRWRRTRLANCTMPTHLVSLVKPKRQPWLPTRQRPSIRLRRSCTRLRVRRGKRVHCQGRA